MFLIKKNLMTKPLTHKFHQTLNIWDMYNSSNNRKYTLQGNVILEGSLPKPPPLETDLKVI